MHSLTPWPQTTPPPVRKDEKTRKSRAPDQLASFGIGPRHVPPVQRGQPDKDHPGETIDIVV